MPCSVSVIVLIGHRASSKSTVVEHMLHHPKVEGLNQTATPRTGKDEMARRLSVIMLDVVAPVHHW
jgi:hypothetical protein